MDFQLIIIIENNKQNNNQLMCCHSLVDSKAIALEGYVCRPTEAELLYLNTYYRAITDDSGY